MLFRIVLSKAHINISNTWLFLLSCVTTIFERSHVSKLLRIVGSIRNQPAKSKSVPVGYEILIKFESAVPHSALAWTHLEISRSRNAAQIQNQHQFPSSSKPGITVIFTTVVIVLPSAENLRYCPDTLHVLWNKPLSIIFTW